MIGCQRFYHSSDCSERSHYTVVVVVAELAVIVMPLSRMDGLVLMTQVQTWFWSQCHALADLEEKFEPLHLVIHTVKPDPTMLLNSHIVFDLDTI